MTTVARREVSADPLSAIDWGTSLAARSVDVYFAPWGQTIDGQASQGWLTFEKRQVMLALRQIEKVAKLDFKVTRTESGAEFRLATTAFDNNTVSYMIPPGKRDAGLGVFDVRYLAETDAGSGTSLLVHGGWMFSVLLHEFGHGLGLAHPHDGGGGSTVLAGVTSPWGSFGIGELNQGIFTALSYNNGWPAGPDGRRYQTGVGDDCLVRVNDFGYEATMMALDIAVLQQKYGANRSFAKGDDTYRLPDANRAGTFFECIWDAGGTDTLRYDGARSAILDLRAATLAGAVGGGGFVSHADSIHGGFTLAAGARIENAVGGSGDDRCIGNTAGNQLLGRGGDDRLNGRGGADRMEGGPGDDRYRLDHPRDRIVEASEAGIDQVSASIGHRLARNVENLILTKQAVDGVGNRLGNAISGNAGGNVLRGMAGDDVLEGGLGHDHLEGGHGADMFVFRATQDSVPGALRDVIEDFNPRVDRIDLVRIDADTTTPGDQAFVFIADAAFSGTPSELRGQGGLLEADVDGDGRADMQIAVAPGAMLAESCFLL